MELVETLWIAVSFKLFVKIFFQLFIFAKNRRAARIWKSSNKKPLNRSWGGTFIGAWISIKIA